MAGLSFIDVDLGKAAPLAVLAGIGFGLWYVWQKSQAQAATDAAAAQASPLAAYQAAEDLSLLQSFTGGSSVPAGGTTTAATTTPTQNPALPAYSAPGNPAQNTTAPATGVTTIAASATSNGI